MRQNLNASSVRQVKLYIFEKNFNNCATMSPVFAIVERSLQWNVFEQ